MRLLKKLTGIGLLLASIACLPVHAADAPQDVVKNAVDKMVLELNKDKATLQQQPQKLYKLVEDIVLPHFDFKRMAALVLAQNWRQATDAQKEEFTKQFQMLIVRTYAKSLLEYTDEQVEFKSIRGDLNSRKVTVPTVVKKPGGGMAVPMDYDMYQPKDEWLVYDVKVDNVSLVVNYKTSYADKVRQQGLDALIKELADKNQQENKG